MKIVAISDVHTKWKNLIIPECDVLISTGDYSYHGEKHIVEGFHEWLNKQPAKHVISVQGNHETWVEKNFEEAKAAAIKACPRVHFVQEELIEIEGIKIWCSAWTPWFHAWAWNARRGEEIKKHWDLIPTDIDILATHGPPYGILDAVYFTDGVTIKERVGCQDLMKRIGELTKMKVHIFGHIHGSHGSKSFDNKMYFNASICDEIYYPSNPITLIDFEP